DVARRHSSSLADDGSAPQARLFAFPVDHVLVMPRVHCWYSHRSVPSRSLPDSPPVLHSAGGEPATGVFETVPRLRVSGGDMVAGRRRWQLRSMSPFEALVLEALVPATRPGWIER